jgi:hypothetical protein
MIPASGLTISPERRKELMAISGQRTSDDEEEGGGSEDEMSESISELPSFSQGGTPKPARRATGAPEVQPGHFDRCSNKFSTQFLHITLYIIVFVLSLCACTYVSRVACIRRTDFFLFVH